MNDQILANICEFRQKGSNSQKNEDVGDKSFYNDDLLMDYENCYKDHFTSRE